MKRLFATVSVAIVIFAGASCARSSAPTSPSALPSPTRPTASLSGLVFAATPTGLAPVDGARVRLEIGSFRLDATTDQNGLYTLPGLYEGSSNVSTTKEGYETDTRNVAISGNVRLDIRVVRRVPYTLSGAVYEETTTGRTPIEGVEIYCDGCGSEVGHTFVYTDKNGLYSLAWSYNGTYPLLVRKEGYAVVDPSGVHSPNGKNATVNGDTRVDIQLVRR